MTTRDSIYLSADTTEIGQPMRTADAVYVSGAPFPVRLVLSTRSLQASTPSPAAPQREATLALHMSQEAAIQVFAAIQKIAVAMKWSLPKEDEMQA